VRHHSAHIHRALLMVASAAILAGCGAEAYKAGNSAENLSVSPQNTSLITGVNRISVALLDPRQNPITARDVTVRIANAAGAIIETRAMSNIGPEYNGIPVLVGIARFPDIGQYEYLVSGTGPGGGHLSGHAYVTVQQRPRDVEVGDHVPLVSQAILGDPGISIATIDSGVPPDSWHGTTIAQGVAQHRPMVLYFGDPAYCPTKTCGPTRQILQQLCTQFCAHMTFEHIETYYPAGLPGPTAKVNPAFDAFGLQTDPWVFMVNANGVVSDRFEGPVTLAELEDSAQGTLDGRVPAVTLS